MLEYWDTQKNINFSFETNGKLMALGVPLLKHFRVLKNPVYLHHTLLSLYRQRLITAFSSILCKKVPTHEVPCIAMATSKAMSD